MKKLLLSGSVAVIITLMAVAAFAAGTASQNVSVNATVQSKCNAVAAGTMTFDIDPATAGNVAPSVNTQPQVQCTKNRVVGVSVNSSNNATVDSSGIFNSTLTHAGCTAIPYTLTYSTAPTGAGFAAGSFVNFNVTGSITAAAANAADYCGGNSLGDTVTMTIAY